MIAFPSMLVKAAEEAGIEVPDDPDNFDVEKYSHWNVFINAQCGQSMPVPYAHWENAKVIAKIPLEKIKLVTTEELVDLGFMVGNSSAFT